MNIVECSVKSLRLNQWLGSLLSSRTVLSLSSRQPQSSKSGFPKSLLGEPKLIADMLALLI